MIMNGNSTVNHYKRNLFLAAGGSALLAILGTLAVLSWMGWLMPPQASTQTMVHQMGAQVMPFDLSQTMHVFEMTESGGIQQVIAKDPGDSAQIALIQQHLQHESMLFGEGNFSDPTSLHGEDMPGIKELSSGASKVKVEYASLPNGAQITFTTQDIRLITAIHRWFGAQLSDHGADATYR
jgi:hypothetical protein